MLGIPAGEAFLLLQELVQGICILAVDLDLLEAGELGAEVHLAELMDAFIGARSLLSELVAGEVENLETLAVVLLVKGLQLVVLWGEAALGGCVDNQQHFVGILFQRYIFTFSVFYREIINGFHLSFKISVRTLVSLPQSYEKSL